MNLKQIIAAHFNVSYISDEYLEPEKFIPVVCPFAEHSTGKKKAGLNFYSQVLNCFGCGKAYSFKKVASHLGLDYKIEEGSMEELLESILPSERITYPIKKPIADYTKFLEEKQMTPEVIAKWNGELVVDKSNEMYGYLKFTLQGGGWCAKKIVEKAKGLGDGERFYNRGNRTLLGFENIKSFETLILAEGITDFLSLDLLGYENIICSMGSQLSEAQAYLLRNRTVFILYDRDYSGYDGAIKAVEILRRFNATGIILELQDIDGEKTDVNRWFCHDKETFRQWLISETTKYDKFDTKYLSNLKTKQDNQLRFYRTGIESLDKAIGGGMTTGVYGFTGDTGIGKTTIATTFVPEFVEQDARVLLCTYEVPKQQMWARLASRYSQHSFVELEKDFTLLEDEIYKHHLFNISNHLRIDVAPTVQEIEASAKKFDIIIIDYLQRMHPPLGVTDTNTAIAKNSAELSRIMLKHNKTIIVISSMSEAGTMFKGTGDARYTNVANFLLHKIGSSAMRLEVKKNTRGPEGMSIFLKSNYPHQSIVETESPGD